MNVNVIDGLGVPSNYEHRWLSTQCSQDFWGGLLPGLLGGLLSGAHHAPKQPARVNHQQNLSLVQRPPNWSLFLLTADFEL